MIPAANSIQLNSRMAKSLEDAKVGDYGIHLMRCFATDMHYERQEGRNRLTLRFVGPH
jgi:anti-sigma regulatory factor (Ser/Thr protein kinase)